jgi:hypothetical protein
MLYTSGRLDMIVLSVTKITVRCGKVLSQLGTQVMY